ncbi:MAG TPA: alanyl-tRNA editing protein [Gemmatimonadales bacterium]|nr:alanyl-tRNA editing protein [Gemmatimonadales bacterium]
MAQALTERLYYTDAYLARFDGTVVDRHDDGRRIYLDRTAFYPTSGGQPHDLGRLDDVSVVDVVDEGNRIAHVLAEPLASETVTGELDWARRFDHMQQHTGQHLLSAVVADLFGFGTVSVHFGPATSTIDLDTPAIDPAQVTGAEARVNAAVWEQRPVDVTFEDASTAGGLRKPTDREGVIRIVGIRGLDRSACGGTHVRNTAEIGPVLLRGAERVRKSVRLEFVCGMRAIGAARADRQLLARLSAQSSAAPEDLPGILESQRAELKAAAAARREAVESLAGYRAREMYQATAPDAAGLRRAVVRDASALEPARVLAQAFTALPRAVLVVLVASPPSVLLAASADSGVDAGARLKAALSAAGGRGGGSPRLAQGSVPDAAALAGVVTALTAP